MYEDYLDKKVYLITNSKRTYSGIVTKISEDGLMLDDVKIGLKYFSNKQIGSIELYRSKEKKRDDMNGEHGTN